MAYHSHYNEKIEYVSHIIEGINVIIFDVIAFHLPGR